MFYTENLLKYLLSDIATLSTGIYAHPDILADTLYLQGNHFANNGNLSASVKPQIKLSDKHIRHLLQNDDLLFAAKGWNNFAVVYHNSIGQAVASSSFIIIRLESQYRQFVLPEYLAWYVNNSKQIDIFHKAKATTTIPSISISQLSHLEINVPKISTQESILNIQRLRSKENETISRLELLKDQLTKALLLNAAKK